jgi:hypothetical protein
MNDSFPVLMGLLGVGAYGGFWFVLFRKAGYETQRCVWMTVAMFIPVANVGMAIYFVTTIWPVQSALSAYRALHGKAGGITQDDPLALLSAASRLELSGQVPAAIATYEEITRRFAGTEAARDAEASIRSLKAKIA